VLVALPEVFPMTGGFLGHMNVSTLNTKLFLCMTAAAGA